MNKRKPPVPPPYDYKDRRVDRDITGPCVFLVLIIAVLFAVVYFGGR